MPDEIGTETTCSDARSAEEVLFGDDVDDAAAEAVDEEEPEAAQDPEDPDDAGGQAIPQEELKVVLSVKGSRATIGVQQPSSDPHIEAFDGLDLTGLAQEAPAVVVRAKARWEDEPRYPAHERPAPPARRRTRREQGAAQASTAEEGTEQQQPEMLRLF